MNRVLPLHKSRQVDVWTHYLSYVILRCVLLYYLLFVEFCFAFSLLTVVVFFEYVLVCSRVASVFTNYIR